LMIAITSFICSPLHVAAFPFWPWVVSRVNPKGESSRVPTPPPRSNSLALRGFPQVRPT
jgi:hypothetical protein